MRPCCPLGFGIILDPFCFAAKTRAFFFDSSLPGVEQCNASMSQTHRVERCNSLLRYSRSFCALLRSDCSAESLGSAFLRVSLAMVNTRESLEEVAQRGCQSKIKQTSDMCTWMCRMVGEYNFAALPDSYFESVLYYQPCHLTKTKGRFLNDVDANLRVAKFW
jgi:hypothetical protein